MAQSDDRAGAVLRPRHHLGSLDGWDWFGHSGGLQGYIGTCVYPAQELTVCVLTNAVDGWAHPGSTASRHPAGFRARRRADPQGAGLERALVEPVDRASIFVPVGNKVLALGARPARADDQRARARDRPAAPPGRHRERARLRQSRRAACVVCARSPAGSPRLQIAGTKYLPADKLARESRRATTEPKAQDSRRPEQG